MKVENARYSFADLQGWRMGVRRLLAQDVFTGVGVDDARNAISVYVGRQEDLPAARTALSRIGIPSDAYQLEVLQGVQQATLRDRVRPPAGGLQIQFGTSTGNQCTLGVNVTFNGISGFLTASHCSAIQGQTENTPYYNKVGDTDVLAQEYQDTEISSAQFCIDNIEDPTIEKYKCQFADVLFARYSSGIAATSGRIYKVSKVPPTLSTLGNRNIVDDSAGQLQTYRVVGSGLRPPVNKLLFKNGAISGYSQMYVDDNNFDWKPGTEVGVEPVVRVNIVKVSSRQNLVPVSCLGDSGSAIYAPSSETEVYLYGILSGGDRSTYVIREGQYCTTTSFFTPMDNIFKAFGSSNLKVTN